MGYFTGKTIIITGAGFAALKDGSAGSIGFGIATAFAKEGANLAITGRNVKKLEAAKERLEGEFGIRVLPIQADVNAQADNQAVVKAAVDQVMAEFGRIDALVNNAQAPLPASPSPITPPPSSIWRCIPACTRPSTTCRRAIRT